MLAITGCRDIHVDPDDLGRMRNLPRGPLEASSPTGCPYLGVTALPQEGG